MSAGSFGVAAAFGGNSRLGLFRLHLQRRLKRSGEVHAGVLCRVGERLQLASHQGVLR